MLDYNSGEVLGGSLVAMVDAMFNAVVDAYNG